MITGGADDSLFDNSVDCTRQPENEKASKNEMDEEFIRRVVRNP